MPPSAWICRRRPSLSVAEWTVPRSRAIRHGHRPHLGPSAGRLIRCAHQHGLEPRSGRPARLKGQQVSGHRGCQRSSGPGSNPTTRGDTHRVAGHADVATRLVRSGVGVGAGRRPRHLPLLLHLRGPPDDALVPGHSPPRVAMARPLLVSMHDRIEVERRWLHDALAGAGGQQGTPHAFGDCLLRPREPTRTVRVRPDRRSRYRCPR